MKNVLVALAFLLICLVPGQAQVAQKFKSPEEAVKALQKALSSSGNTPLLNLFGEDTKPLLDDADEAGLQESRRLLNLLFEERWDLAPTEDGNRIIRLGMEGWPFPVPLVASGSTWSFDTKAGLEEIENRRVGRNELIAIETLKRIVDAEEDFRLRDANDDGVREYSSQFRSTEGRKDGLFWPAEGEFLSPLQEALADSWKYAEGRVEGSPWFGYRFRFLEGQGAQAPGGALDYVVNGKQMVGYALVAFPANYGKSGIMTFLVSQDGVIYQADLGDKTAELAEAMKQFDPGTDWSVVEEY